MWGSGGGEGGVFGAFGSDVRLSRHSRGRQRSFWYVPRQCVIAPVTSFTAMSLQYEGSPYASRSGCGMKLLGLFLDHATEAGACCGEVVFNSPKLITSLIELCCKPGVFAAVVIVSRDKFIDSAPE
jgi:hypothetical protein